MNFENLANNIQSIQDALQAQAAHSINMAITTRNWLTGCYIRQRADTPQATSTAPLTIP